MHLSAAAPDLSPKSVAIFLNVNRKSLFVPLSPSTSKDPLLQGEKSALPFVNVTPSPLVTDKTSGLLENRWLFPGSPDQYPSLLGRRGARPARPPAGSIPYGNPPPSGPSIDAYCKEPATASTFFPEFS